MAPALGPVAVTVAPNGSYRSKADHPALPVTPHDLARCAAACREQGAAMFHLHVRDRDGRHLLDADAYREATQAIREAVGRDMVIQPTSEAAGRYTAREQIDVITALRPEAVSIAVRELVGSEDDVAPASRFLADLDGFGTMVQIIIYSPDDLRTYRSLRRRGAFGSRTQSLLFVLGRYALDQLSKPSDLLPFLTDPLEEAFCVCAFGPAERDCVLTAALLGGDVRVGFENNLFLPDGSPAPSNEAQIGSIAGSLAGLGRRCADADELRARYG